MEQTPVKKIILLGGDEIKEIGNMTKGRSCGLLSLKKILAPQVGFEPTTLRLTAECSTIELLRSKTERYQAYQPEIRKRYERNLPENWWT